MKLILWDETMNVMFKCDNQVIDEPIYQSEDQFMCEKRWGQLWWCKHETQSLINTNILRFIMNMSDSDFITLLIWFFSDLYWSIDHFEDSVNNKHIDVRCDTNLPEASEHRK